MLSYLVHFLTKRGKHEWIHKVGFYLQKQHLLIHIDLTVQELTENNKFIQKYQQIIAFGPN